MRSQSLTLDDFQRTIRQFRATAKRMGGMGALLGVILGPKRSPEDALDHVDASELHRLDLRLRRWASAIDSMTIEERTDPDLLRDASRQLRVAMGAGVDASSVGTMLRHFSRIREDFRRMWPR